MNLLLRLANSAQRLSRFIRRRKVLLQSLAGALALGLGLWGWMLEEPPVNIQGWLNNIFRTFQMITLQFPRSFDMNISWQLQLARLLLPAVAALATLHVIVGAITRPARLALMPHAHGHIIVCGSEQLTEASLKTLAKRGEQIVVAASDMEVARRETLEGLGLTVIEADPAQPSTFSALNAKQAAAIFFTYDQDLANIDLAMQAMANISGRPASDPPLALAVLIEREDLARELDATLDRLARARRVRYHRLCPDRDGLRQELQRLAPAFRKADAAARSHLLIIGLAGVWRQTLMQLIVSAQDNADRPPLLTLALDDAEAEALDAWRAQTPDLHLVAEFAIIHRDGTLLPTEEELASHPIEAPHLVVVLRPDEDAVATALALRRPENVFGLTDQPILVRRTAEDRFLGRLSDDGREAAPRIAAFGGLIRAWSAQLSILAGIVIIIMGLHFLGLTRIGLLMREGRLPIPKPVGLWGAYVMGLAFAFGWTPCIGPILAAILSVAAAEATVAKGAMLLAVYSAGLGIPFLLAAFAVEQFSELFLRMKKHLARVEHAMGVLMVITGVAFLTGAISNVSIWLLETFPALQNFG